MVNWNYSTYDQIVVGAGITGACLAYELVKLGFKVLLLDKALVTESATQYSYGGIAYWSGTNDFTKQLCSEGIKLHRNLSAELEYDTQFREIDLLLTISPTDNPESYQEEYQKFAIAPELLTPEVACKQEPLLNPEAISGVLRLPHAQVNPVAIIHAYHQAFTRLGGEFKAAEVVKLVNKDNTIEGVITVDSTYLAANTILCAGAFSNQLLATANIPLEISYSEAQVIVTPPVDIHLQHIIMPANLQRIELEKAKSGSVLDLGAAPLTNGQLLLGQISQVGKGDWGDGEARIRASMASLLPRLANLPGTLHSCLVTFANPQHPLVGPIRDYQGIQLFTGFTSTFVIAPALARHYALWAKTGQDEVIDSLLG